MDINEQADPAGIGVPSSEAFGSPALSVEKDAGAASWGAGRPEDQPVGPGIGRPPTEYEMAYLAMDTLRKDVRLRQGLAVALNESEMDLLHRVEAGVHNLSKRAAAKGHGSVVLEQTEPHGVYVPSVDPYAREAQPNTGSEENQEKMRTLVSRSRQALLDGYLVAKYHQRISNAYADGARPFSEALESALEEIRLEFAPEPIRWSDMTRKRVVGLTLAAMEESLGATEEEVQAMRRQKISAVDTPNENPVQPNAGEAAYNFTEHVEPPSDGARDSAGDGATVHLPQETAPNSPQEPARKPSFIDQVREILGTPSSSDHEALTVMIGVAIESLRQCERPYSNLPDAARQEVLGRTVRNLFENLTREEPSPELISSVEKRNICRAQGFLPITGTPIPDWNIPKADAPKTAQKTDIAPKKVYDYDLDFKGTLLEHMERSNCPGFQSAAARLLIGDERLAELQAGNRRVVQDLARELAEKRDALRSRLPRVSEGVSPPGESAADVVQRLQGEDAKSTYKD